MRKYALLTKLSPLKHFTPFLMSIEVEQIFKLKCTSNR